MNKRFLSILIASVLATVLFTSCDAANNKGGTSGSGEGSGNADSELYARVDDVGIRISDFEKIFSVFEHDYGVDYLRNEEQGILLRDLMRIKLLDSTILGICYKKYYEAKGQGLSKEELDSKYAMYKEQINADSEKKKLFESLGVGEDLQRAELERNYYSIKFTQELSDELRANYDLSEDELKVTKLTVNVRQILVKDEALAEEIRKKLVSGADFEQLLKEHSIDEVSKTRGGELGTIKYEDMPTEFSKEVFLMQKGQISKPIKTIFGYHVVEMLDYVTVESLSEETEIGKAEIGHIREEIFNRRLLEALEDRREKLLSEHVIEHLRDVNAE